MFNPTNSPDLQRGVKFVEATSQREPRFPPKAKIIGQDEKELRNEMLPLLRDPFFYNVVLKFYGAGVLRDIDKHPRHPRIALDYLKEWTGEEGQPQYDETLPFPRPTTIREPVKLPHYTGSRALDLFPFRKPHY
jgi:hypothetical protein